MTSRGLALVAAVSVVSLLAGCKSGPSAPTRSGNAVLNLEILGPNRLNGVADTAQLEAQITFADGSKENCSTRCRWQVSDGQVATVTNGLVRALALGRTLVTVEYLGLRSELQLTVMPANTYALDGHVTETGFGPVALASVEIVGGSDAGRSMLSTAAGFFAFFGVSGDLQLRVSKAGYTTQTISLTINGDTTHDVDLQPLEPSVPIDGDYQLTLQAAPQCHLPAEAMMRQYSAHVTKAGTRVDVKLSGGGLDNSFADQAFSGRLLGNEVTFDILFDDYYAIYSVFEKLSDMLYLGFHGTAAGTAQPGMISTTLSGSIDTFTKPPRNGPPTATCTGSHQLTFVSASSTSRGR